MDVSIIGSGNVAWHLAPALDNLGHVVREVYSRNPRNAAALAERLYQAEVKASLDFSTSKSRLFLIAVADDAIQSIVSEIILPDNSLLVHTSGSQPLHLLQFAAPQGMGVFYPLQTFSKSKKLDFKSIPIFLECGDEEAKRLLKDVAKSLSKSVYTITAEERKALHVAAVFASNFSNHMLKLSKDIMQQHSLDYDLLKPLILETIQKSLSIGPEGAQTGPAVRGDLEILDQEAYFLHESEKVAEIYRLISQHILDTYSPD